MQTRGVARSLHPDSAPLQLAGASSPTCWRCKDCTCYPWVMPRIAEDLSGRTFGSWTVQHRAPDVPTIKETIWTCQCSCGSVADVPRSNLMRGRSTQCASCRDLAAKKPPKPKALRPRVKLVGAAHPRWRGNAIVYSSAHKRVVAAKGKAAAHGCVDCSSPAQDWSFTKVECETRMVSSEGRPYCTHPEHYEPRCRDCHNRFDHP